MSMLPTADRPALSDTLARLQAARRLAILVAGGLVLITEPGLGIPLPGLPLALILGGLLAVNSLAAHRLTRRADATPADVLQHLLVDLAGLTLLLHFSGGVTNPLISLLLPPVAIAALTLARRQVALVAGLAIAAYSGLLVFYQPLVLADPQRATQLHLTGMWLTFVVSAALIAGLIMRLMASVRQRDAELAAAREQGLRDEHVLALGTLAAGTAHELGTPLATMAVLVGELRHDPGLNAAQQADLALVAEQIGTCKSLLSQLARRAGGERLESAAAEPVDRWLEGLRQRWHARQPTPPTRLIAPAADDAPRIVADPRLEQALFNLLDNAARVSPPDHPIELAVDHAPGQLILRVRDAGPGFPAAILARAGQTAAPAHAGGQGIGLMLTRSAIEQMGGQLHLRNEAGGALAEIRLPHRIP